MTDLSETVGEAFKQSQSIFREALGIKSDPGLELYRSMTDDDFEAVRMKLGDEATFAYIRQQEAKLHGISGRRS